MALEIHQIAVRVPQAEREGVKLVPAAVNVVYHEAVEVVYGGAKRFVDHDASDNVRLPPWAKRPCEAPEVCGALKRASSAGSR